MHTHTPPIDDLVWWHNKFAELHSKSKTSEETDTSKEIPKSKNNRKV